MTPPTSTCSSCGAPLAESANYCERCGQPVQGDETYRYIPEKPSPQPAPTYKYPETQQNAPASTPQETLYSPPQGATTPSPPPLPPRRSWNWIILAGAGLAILCCLCIVAVLILGGGWMKLVRQATGNDLEPTLTLEVFNLPIPEAAGALATDGPAPTVIPASPTSQPTINPTNEPAFTAEPTLPGVDFDGFSFKYDPSLARSVLAEKIPEVSGADVPEWEVVPEHIQFTFDQYPLSQSSFLPQIWIYPVQDIIRLNSLVGGTISDLEMLLVEKPTEKPQSNLPFLPLWNAAQLIRARYGYLGFEIGSGIRYLTQFGQDAYPINNQDLIYTFQGMTEDGAYYISAILPVTHPSLPDPATINLDSSFYENFTSYAAQTELILSQAPADSFTPDLSLLDELVESIRAQR